MRTASHGYLDENLKTEVMQLESVVEEFHSVAEP